MKALKELRIAFCSDHAGYELKQYLTEKLEGELAGCKDFGCFSAESCDYPDFAHPLATAVENGEFDYGIIMCGTGNGVNMTANKHQGIRSALCWDKEVARLVRAHNDANILALPARFISQESALELVRIFLTTDFEGGRHLRRINKIPLGEIVSKERG